MICEVKVCIGELEVEDVLKVIRQLRELQLELPQRLGVVDFVESLCRCVYRYEQWCGKVDLLVTVSDFNLLMSLLEQRGLRPVYTSYSKFVDCVELHLGDKPILVVCEDPDLYPEYKRVTLLDLASLRRLVQIRFSILNYRGEHIANYVRGLCIITTTLRLPVLYILHLTRLREDELMLCYRASLERGILEVNENLLAYSLAYYTKDVGKLGSVAYFMLIDDLRKLTTILEDCYLEERDRRLFLYADGTLVLACTLVDKKVCRLSYVDLPELVKRGVDFEMVKLHVD